MKAFGVISVLGTAVAALLAMASCSSSNSGPSPTPSALGESCTRTNDCQSGLACIANTCVVRGSATVDAGTGSNPDAGDGGTITVSTRLGAACASTAECADATLTCVPSPLGGIKGGICDLASYGIVPSQKTCGECAQASDCCELPFDFAQANGLEVVTPSGGFFVHTCSDLLQLVIGGDTSVCGGAGPGTIATACNFYAQFCTGCAIDSWACNSGECAYTGPCTVGTTAIDQWGACPTLSPSGRGLQLGCVGNDASTTGTCVPGFCTRDLDCVGEVPPDQGNNSQSKCAGTDCVCYQNACYFPCSTDLDCQGGYACDTTNKVCVLTGCIPGAPADATCKVQLGDARAVCRQLGGPGTCVIPCAGDHDCSPFSGAIPGTSFTPPSVCGANSYCASVVGNCTSDSDCRTQSDAVNGFCVTAPPASNIRSAISNH